MERTHHHTCVLCGSEFYIHKYGDGVCPTCETVYEWDETYVVRLTKEQAAAALKATTPREGRE